MHVGTSIPLSLLGAWGSTGAFPKYTEQIHRLINAFNSRNAGTCTINTACITFFSLQHHDMRWLPTPSFLLSTTSSALRFSSPSVLRRPSTLVQQQGLLALGFTRPILFNLQHHHQQRHSLPELSQRLSPSLNIRAHSTTASTTTMATREEKDRYVRTLFWTEDETASSSFGRPLVGSSATSCLCKYGNVHSTSWVLCLVISRHLCSYQMHPQSTPLPTLPHLSYHSAWALSRSQSTAIGVHRRSVPSSTSTLGKIPCPEKSSR